MAWLIERREAERLLAEKGFFLDSSKQPDLGGVKEFGPKYLGKILADSMNVTSYYESIFPYFRSMDRAKEQAIAFFEGKYGKIVDEGVRSGLISAAEKIGEVPFLCARDKDGKRVVLILEKSGLQEVASKAGSAGEWRPSFK